MATRRKTKRTAKRGSSKPKPRRREVTEDGVLVLKRGRPMTYFIVNPGAVGKKITVSPEGGITIGKN